MKRYRVFIAGMGLLFAGAGCLTAQSNTAEVFGGYAYAKINPESNLPKESANGWMAGASGYANKWVGAGFEIAGQFGTIAAPGGAPSPSFKEYSYLVGPQLRYLNKKQVQAGVKILLGGVFGQVRLDNSTTASQTQALGAAGIGNFDQTKFALLLSFPVDVTVTKLIAIRAEPGFFRTSFNQDHQGNFRFTVGPVFRFGGK